LETWVPRVPKGFGRSVVHLYETPDAAEAGEPYGGTGFLVVVQGRDIPKPLEVFTNRNEQYAYEGDRTLARSLYVVTARHVVTGGATVIRFNMLPTTPGSFKLETDLDDWKQWEEHDLAILAVELDPSHVDFDAIPATRLAHEPLPRSFESNNWPQPGDDVFMVGRFVERSGRPHNEVQVRFGNVSMVSEDPIQTKAGELVGYLVEMHQRSGFSGSPVFQFRPSYGAVIGGSDGMAHASLLGVDQGAYPESFGVFTKNGGETNLEFR